MGLFKPPRASRALLQRKWPWYCLNLLAAYIPSNWVLQTQMGPRMPASWIEYLVAPFALLAYLLPGGIASTVIVLVVFVALHMLLFGLAVASAKAKKGFGKFARFIVPVIIALVCGWQAQLMIGSMLEDMFRGMH
jgi:hypothetical protein